MSRLAVNNQVLWVDPISSTSGALRDPARRRELATWPFRLKEQSQGLWVFSPWNLLPLERFETVRRINRAVTLAALKAMMARLRFDAPILWVHYNRALEHFIGDLGEKMVCYDCNDMYVELPGISDEGRRKIGDWEEQTMRKADVVFAASIPFWEEISSFHSNVHLLPNAVDGGFLLVGNEAPPPDMTRIARPIIAYVGAIDKRVDLDMLDHIAFHRPRWSIVLIGPVLHLTDVSSLDQLRSRRNVHLLGEKDPALLPGYLEAIDVGLIPFRQVTYTTTLSHPNKLLEYLSAGKPVVSVRLAGIERFVELVRVATTGDEFLNQISEALLESDESLVERRRMIAAENTWDKRVETIENAIQRYLATNEPGPSKR